MTNTTIVRNTHFWFCPTSVLVDTHSTIEGYVVWLSPALLLKTKREKCLLIYIDVSCTSSERAGKRPGESEKKEGITFTTVLGSDHPLLPCTPISRIVALTIEAKVKAISTICQCHRQMLPYSGRAARPISSGMTRNNSRTLGYIHTHWEKTSWRRRSRSESTFPKSWCTISSTYA